MAGPLTGIRVIELAGLGPAPFAAMVLADLGADVLAIDRPGATPITPDAHAPLISDTNPYDVMNRSRRRITLDLRSPDGAALLLDLVATADVLLEGFRPGVVERLGVGPQECRSRNERLVFARMTGWGQDGPAAHRAGHDLNYLAQAGVLAHIGRSEQPPTPPLNLVADFGGGAMMVVIGILAALLERTTSGEGQTVDAAMVDGAALLMAPLFGAWSSGFWSERRGDNLLDSGAPFYDCYECADGGWMAVAAIEPQFFSELVRVLDLVDHASVRDQHDRLVWPAMRAAFAEAFRRHTRDEWERSFAGVDACVSPVLSMGEAPGHPLATQRSAFVEMDGVYQPGPAPRFSRSKNAVPEPARVHEDAVTVLRDWGIDPQIARAMKDSGVLQ